ncbi:MAG: type II secretion system protein [Verrucomicrobiae bacterium]|nr:type II secretion system protein [Verrucomicrobiae bacterium]
MRSRRYTRPSRQHGFSLVEMLVTLAIVAALGGMLLPALSRARARGKQAACASNLCQIGIAAKLYINDYGVYPPAWVSSEARWMDLLKGVISKKSEVFLCPSDTQRLAVAWDPEIHLSYGLNCFNFGGNATCFWYGVRPENVRRPSATIFAADCTPGKYYCGGGGVFAEPVVDVAYRHTGKMFCALFCDGHAETRSRTTRDDWDASR